MSTQDRVAAIATVFHGLAADLDRIGTRISDFISDVVEMQQYSDAALDALGPALDGDVAEQERNHEFAGKLKDKVAQMQRKYPHLRRPAFPDAQYDVPYTYEDFSNLSSAISKLLKPPGLQ